MGFFDANFWFTICFLLFLYITYKPTKKLIVGTLTTKINSIKDRLHEVKTLKRNAEIILKTTEEKIASLTLLQEKMISESKIAAENFMQIKQKQIELSIERKKLDWQQSIDSKQMQLHNQLKTQLIQDVQKLVVEYFKTSNNASISDIEIAKRLSKARQMNDTQII